MRAFHFDRFTIPLPGGHRFPASKYRMLRERVIAEPGLGIRLEAAPEAGDGELALAHAPAYLDAVFHGLLSDAQQREIGFPWSPQLVERSRHSVGATIAAARAALADGVAAQLGGGTHHARADAGSGFCVFNDVAVAARLMQAEVHRRERRLLHVLVIDLDVHQGNGTAAIFADDPTVFTLSLHGAKNFPFRKHAGDLDVALPDDCGDEAYLTALSSALAEVDRCQGPGESAGLAFYLAGADPHEGDRLGRLKISAAGLAERDRRVFDWLGERRIPVAVTMAGGYGHDIAVTVGVHLQTLICAGQYHRQWQARSAGQRADLPAARSTSLRRPPP
jgi:acetoin utilization deacetylase AcuC-like enzyme